MSKIASHITEYLVDCALRLPCCGQHKNIQYTFIYTWKTALAQRQQKTYVQCSWLRAIHVLCMRLNEHARACVYEREWNINTAVFGETKQLLLGAQWWWRCSRIQTIRKLRKRQITFAYVSCILSIPFVIKLFMFLFCDCIRMPSHIVGGSTCS